MKPNPNPNQNQNQNQNSMRGEPTPQVTTPSKKVTLQPKGGGDEVNKFFVIQKKKKCSPHYRN